VNHHHEVGIIDRRDRHEIPHQDKRLVGNERFVGRVRVGHREQRVAVGRGLRDSIAADDGAGAGAILDDEGLLERLGKVLRQHAGIDVGRPARTKRHDDLHGMGGIILRKRRRGRNGTAQN